MITFSYHYAAADRFLDLLLELSIIPACGHDQTVDERILAGFARGLRHVTHIYSMNASFMRVDGRKHLGTLEMALMTPGIMVEVIADGKHITEHFWRFIRHNKSVDDIVIVSDSMRWAGMPDDPDRVHKLGDVDVIVDDGVAWLADRSAFAGSVGTMHGMFRRLVQEWGVDLSSAVQMTSANQARELGIDDRVGAVKPGMAADFVILDEDLEIKQVVKAGRSFRSDSQAS
jgi:N-acetylglucosamine-6-phosphate deacetylase